MKTTFMSMKHSSVKIFYNNNNVEYVNNFISSSDVRCKSLCTDYTNVLSHILSKYINKVYRIVLLFPYIIHKVDLATIAS